LLLLLGNVLRVVESITGTAVAAPACGRRLLLAADDEGTSCPSRSVSSVELVGSGVMLIVGRAY
jgi:hypothetical protein